MTTWIYRSNMAGAVSNDEEPQPHPLARPPRPDRPSQAQLPYRSRPCSAGTPAGGPSTSYASRR